MYCLAVDPTETIVVSSGIDSSVVQFNYIAPRENSDWRDWVGTLVHNQHTHDVRAIQIINKCVVTGGRSYVYILASTGCLIWPIIGACWSSGSAFDLRSKGT